MDIVDKKSYWVAVGNGFLKIGHKPGGKKRSFQSLYDEKTSTVLTILSEREGAISIGENVKSFGMEWLWLPLRDGNIPSRSIIPQIISVFEIMVEKLNSNQKIYIHCSAGLHRTGMITNALLLFWGHDKQTAFEIIQKLRPITAVEVSEHRLAWGNQFQKGKI